MNQGPIGGLSKIITAFDRERPFDLAMYEALEGAKALLGAEDASVHIRHGTEIRQLAPSEPRFRRPQTLTGEGIIGWVATHGHPIRLGDAPTDPRFRPDDHRHADTRSVLALPLKSGNRVLGVLCGTCSTPEVFDGNHDNLAHIIGHFFAQALRMAELEREAVTDGLTGAFNRNYLTSCLEAETNRAFRTGRPISLLSMDLDHFKHVNDRHGHTVGDVVLKMFTDIVRRCVRSFDVLIRRGGEEFLLVMPSTRTQDGLTVAQRIRARLGERPLRLGPGLSVRQTVSIGLATWDGKEDADSLDHRSDVAMYEAKREGRNRIMASPMPASDAPSWTGITPTKRSPKPPRGLDAPP